MEGQRRRVSLKERLRLGWCGPSCCRGFLTPSTTTMSDHDVPTHPLVDQPPCASARMNLAAALAAERQLSRGMESKQRVSLMRLLEERDDAEIMGMGRSVENDDDEWVCCLCMGTKKDAAFIPCGHTYCRPCSRHLWLTRGTCPLCNRPILDILHIY